MTKKVCFLYLDEPHNIFHSISLAHAMVESGKYRVDLICTLRNFEFIQSYFEPKFLSILNIITVRPHWHITMPHFYEIKLQFRKSIFIKYKNKFSNYSAIFCSVYNDLELRNTRPHSSGSKLIFVNHGVSNDMNYSYDDSIKQFDFILISGRKEQRIRKEKNQLTQDNNAVVGYLKYDFCKQLQIQNPFQETDKIILYNPHWRRELSSFYSHGVRILEYFASQDKYKLIFAPHSLLLVRNRSLRTKIKRFIDSNSIHIDYSSTALSDMSYTKAAHLYLGDISSQALEFLLHNKRPCLYLKTANTKMNINDYHSWQTGKIVEGNFDIELELSQAFTSHRTLYKNKQAELVDEVFSVEKKSATQRAFLAVDSYLTNNK